MLARHRFVGHTLEKMLKLYKTIFLNISDQCYSLTSARTATFFNTKTGQKNIKGVIKKNFSYFFQYKLVED
jgi:hypothetical protein